MSVRPFVGSSSEHVRIAETVQELLDDLAEVTVWNQAFELGGGTLERLVQTTVPTCPTKASATSCWMKRGARWRAATARTSTSTSRSSRTPSSTPFAWERCPAEEIAIMESGDQGRVRALIDRKLMPH
jgi:hypothetical protein